MKRSNLSKIISILLILLFILGIISLFFLPNLYDIFKESNVSNFFDHNIYYIIAFYSCYILSLTIIFVLINLFSIIYKDSPFNIKIKKYLKIIAIIFMLLFIIVIIKSIFIPTILSFAVAIICFIVSLSFYVLEQIIKSAIIYKNEVELTV